MHFTVVDIQNRDKDREVQDGVTIKFFFNYKAEKDLVELEEKDEEKAEEADFATKVYDNLIATALSN